MASIVNKFRKRKKKDDETFRVESVMDRLEKEGFKPLIKSDILEGRIKELKEGLKNVLSKLNKAESQEKMGEGVDEAVQLVYVISSPWLRSMENRWLAHKINCFIENYRECRRIPAFLDMLVEEAKAIINMSFTNIDVEPLRPIIIQTGPRRVSLGEAVEHY